MVPPVKGRQEGQDGMRQPGARHAIEHAISSCRPKSPWLTSCQQKHCAALLTQCQHFFWKNFGGGAGAESMGAECGTGRENVPVLRHMQDMRYRSGFTRTPSEKPERHARLTALAWIGNQRGKGRPVSLP